MKLTLDENYNCLSHDEDEICMTQGRIYVYMAEKGYELKAFSDEYLSCDFCNREMDAYYSPFHLEAPNICESFFIEQIKGKLIKVAGKENIFAPLANEIGFMYRLLHLETSLPSKEIAKIIPFGDVAAEAHLFDHYGFEYYAHNFIREYGLPRKRYDSEYNPLTDKEMKQIEREALLEHQELERKYLGKVSSKEADYVAG